MRESAVESHIRLAAAERGLQLWRNNTGMAYNEKNVPVRFGLCNESAAMNKRIKSSDWIGITPIVITPDMVGMTIGVFTAIEAKHEGWKFSPVNEREVAQAAYHDIVRKAGGFAGFASSVVEFLRIVRRV